MFWAGESARTDGNYNVGFLFSLLKRVSIKCWWFQANFPFKICKKWEKICVAGGRGTIDYTGATNTETERVERCFLSSPETWSPNNTNSVCEVWGERCLLGKIDKSDGGGLCQEFDPLLTSTRLDNQTEREGEGERERERERMQIRVVSSDNPGWRWRYI